MNKAITDGLALMPPAFANGLDVWSSEDGTPGSATYDGAGNATLVAADGDFGGAIEIVKNDTITKLRYMGETPLLPGMYLQITARIKAISGNLPGVRVAGWAGNSANAHVSGLTEIGTETTLTAYGEVVEVSAIVGVGDRGGVDMPWGLDAEYGHFGIDLTGANGGTVRIDDIQIKDVSSFFFADSLGMIDIRDYGAIGDGTTDCAAAIQAADADANGRKLLFPEGIYHIGTSLTLTHEPVFEGTVTQADADRFALTRGFHLNSYIDAFGDEVLGFKKAFQALLNFTDHDSLDLCGRRIQLDAPLDMHAIVGNKDVFEVRRAIHNGQFDVQSSTAWDPTTVTSSASYTVANNQTLTNVSNIANIEVGSLITGNGVGREVYVKAVNVGAQSLTLSQPLWDANSSQTYTFTRNRYVLDFMGFTKFSQFEIIECEFLCNGHASGILLPPEGLTFIFKDCSLKSPLARGITSAGKACQNLTIDGCNFTSNEQSLDADQRTSIAFNSNNNDTKIRNNRFVKFGHTAVVGGTGHIFVGNHWFQGDNNPASPRQAGIVMTAINVKSIFTGNYIDNAFLEMTNEHDSAPDFSSEFSFGSLTITGNIFMASDAASWFSWIVFKPHGDGHFINGLAVQGNTFKAVNGWLDRVEAVDTTHADFNYSRMRNVVFEGNTFNAISQTSFNPVSLDFTQATAAQNWVLDPSDYLPFGGWARTVESITFDGPLTNNSAQTVYDMPYATKNYGTLSNQVRLTFPQATQGTVRVSVRMDNPV